MPLSTGQGSGDFREFQGRVQIFHAPIRNSVGRATPDAFTQTNPAVVTGATTVSTTLSGITKVGVLGATVAFTRPDIGNGFHGGAKLIAAAYSATLKPLGIFINDAAGNAYENTPGPASNRAPYFCGKGTLGITLWESQILLGGSLGNALTYAAGDVLYASANGLLTKNRTDAYEYNVAGNPAPTVIGVVKIAPDAQNSLLVFDLWI